MTARAGPWALLFAAAAIVAIVVSACGESSAPSNAGPTLRLASGLIPAPSGSGPALPSPSGSVSPSPAAASAAGSAGASGPGRPTARPSDAGGSTAASASASSGEEPFPNTNEQALLDHVKTTIRPSCQRADSFYAHEIDSVSCGGDTVPFVDYTLFPSLDELRSAYDDDVTASESAPVAGGTCAGANYEDTYTLAGADAGRLQCTTRTSSGRHYKVIEWTRESLRTLAYMSSETATWDDLINFWKADAGPIE